MSKKYDSIVIGGGLAGLVSSIVLKNEGLKVLVIEKRTYPFHKVCGEYISNEVRPYLERLGLFPDHLSPATLHTLKVSHAGGGMATVKMPVGGFGISRFEFDHYLYRKALALGVHFVHETVSGCLYDPTTDRFDIQTTAGSSFEARVALGAYGKRSLLDKSLERSFIAQRTDYVGIKYHVQADLPAGEVALHHFKGGYAGLSEVEDGKVNFCYLTEAKVLKSYGSIEDLESKGLSRNPYLAAFMKKAQPLFAQPLVISQVNFSSKPIVEKHVLMCGDAAGLIHPLCGNGMAMAIHAAQMVSAGILAFMRGEYSRSLMEQNYRWQWRNAFKQRLTFGRYAQQLFESPALFRPAINLATKVPWLLQKAVGLSHGSTIH